MTPTKDEARKELEAMPARKAELEKILAEPDVDPREWIGKLCISDWNGAQWRYILEGVDSDEDWTLFYTASTRMVFYNCRPVTLADLEGKIYQPKKASRYDWEAILRAIPGASLAVTNLDGKQYIRVPGNPVQNTSGGWDASMGEWVLFKDGDPCPDWRDSLEEKPEGM